MWSTWAATTVKVPRGRNVTGVTIVPSLIVLVSRARPANVTQASVEAGSPLAEPILSTWSERNRASNPHSSTVRATASSWP